MCIALGAPPPHADVASIAAATSATALAAAGFAAAACVAAAAASCSRPPGNIGSVSLGRDCGVWDRIFLPNFEYIPATNSPLRLIVLNRSVNYSPS